MEINFVFQLLIIIVSIVFHELSHGYAAYLLGDPTAKYAGRLTVNPVKHMDPVGSVIVPLLSFFLGGIVFGWAKPVPYNPYNLRLKRYGELVVALAGPASNFLIALVFSLYLRTFDAAALLSPEANLIVLIVLVNITLAVFNLMPIPPLDGSKILFSLLPLRLRHIKEVIERNALLFVIIFILFFSFVLDPIVWALFRVFTGIEPGL